MAIAMIVWPHVLRIIYSTDTWDELTETATSEKVTHPNYHSSQSLAFLGELVQYINILLIADSPYATINISIRFRARLFQFDAIFYANPFINFNRKNIITEDTKHS